MQLPLVSFCIPVHNSGHFLDKTLQSILAQDYPNIEVICVNDHSSDNSAAILNNYSGKIKTLEANKKGAAAARNLAFQQASGSFIIFFDSDDIINSEFVSRQVLKNMQIPDSVVVSKWGRFYVDDLGSFVEDKNIIKADLSFYDWIIHYWTFNNHTTPPGRVLIPKALIEYSGLWNESLSLNDDLDFFTRVFGCAKKIIYNDEACFYYRSGIGGLSSRTKGYDYQHSNYSSINEATKMALSIFPNDVYIKRACANMWQLFVYENFPNNKSLVKSAKNYIQQLGGADYEFPCGGYTRYAYKVLGWKITKYIKHFQSWNF